MKDRYVDVNHALHALAENATWAATGCWTGWPTWDLCRGVIREPVTVIAYRMMRMPIWEQVKERGL